MRLEPHGQAIRAELIEIEHGGVRHSYRMGTGLAMGCLMMRCLSEVAYLVLYQRDGLWMPREVERKPTNSLGRYTRVKRTE